MICEGFKRQKKGVSQNGEFLRYLKYSPTWLVGLVLAKPSEFQNLELHSCWNTRDWTHKRTLWESPL